MAFTQFHQIYQKIRGNRMLKVFHYWQLLELWDEEKNLQISDEFQRFTGIEINYKTLKEQLKAFIEQQKTPNSVFESALDDYLQTKVKNTEF